MPSASPRFLGLVAALCTALFLAVPAAAQNAAQNDELQEANQLFKQGQLDRAMERVDAYLKTKPKDARGRFLKGIILDKQNKPNEAIKVFTDLTQDYPELPEPYNNLAVLYASQGQFDKARSALEMAIRTHPSYAIAHENLGDIYAKMASQAYDKALQLDKSNTAAKTKLNLIEDLFSAGGSRPAGKTAAAKPENPKVAVAPPAPPAPKPVEKAPELAAKAPPAPPAPVAKAPPPPAKEPVKPANNQDEVIKAVNAWAKAWSDNDVNGYLGHYAANFETPKGETREHWESQRKARIAKPRKIHVDIESPRVVFKEGGRVNVTFRQHYQSGSLKVASTKTLVMVKAGEKWLIQQEKVGG